MMRRQRAPSAHQLLVGGNTKFFGAALFRLRKEDFGEITIRRPLTGMADQL